MLQTVQGGKCSLMRGVMLLTVQGGKVSAGRNVMVQMQGVVRVKRYVTDSAMGKGVVRERLDFTYSVLVKCRWGEK